MGFYSDAFNKGNISGRYSFDGAALKVLAGYEYSDKTAHPEGTVIELKESVGSKEKVADAFLHKNGRQGEKNEDLDTLVMDAATMAALPDDLQAQLFEFDRVPPGVASSGYRKDAK